MKLLLTTVIALGLFAFAGCDKETAPASTTPAAEAHSKDDSHAGEPKGTHAKDGDHSGHDH